MEIKLSNRVERIKPSPTLAVTARAQELRAAGRDVIGLGAGEPDFDTPEHIKEAAIKAIQDGFTRYTPAAGTPELRQAVVDKLSRDNQLDYQPQEILVSCGAKHSLYNLTQALLQEGDEAVIPAPYWVSYPDMVLLTGAKPVVIETSIEQNFKITAEQLDKALNEQSKLVFLNSPSNPTGMAYSRAELKALADVLLKYPKVWVVTDDIYEHILWADEPFSNILMVCPELKERCIVVNGVSKVYAMTGWRIGYAAGPQTLIKAMTKIQGQSTSNPTSISQAASIAALNGPQDCIPMMLKAFKERHDFVVNGLNAIAGFECSPGQGTFYAFPKVEGAIQALGLKNDQELAEHLIEKAEVAVVPGSAFGAAGYVRLSFATSLGVLEEALKRIGSVFS